jgi:hypothetical protein
MVVSVMSQHRADLSDMWGHACFVHIKPGTRCCSDEAARQCGILE